MTRLLWLIGLLVLPVSAQADYSASETDLIRTAASIVDATVTGFTPKGHAQLKVHANWVGTAPPVIKSVTYTCLMSSAAEAGLTVGQRYVLIIDARGNLFEESTAYPIDNDRVKGTPLKSDWQRRTWMPLPQFKAAILAVRRAKAIHPPAASK